MDFAGLPRSRILDGCIDHVLCINRANIQVQQGNFSSWQQNKKYQDRFEQGEHEKIGAGGWAACPRSQAERGMV